MKNCIKDFTGILVAAVLVIGMAGCKFEAENHVHKEDSGTITKEASCTEKGEMTYKCTDCGTVLRTEEISAKGHTTDSGTVTKEATCTEKGEMTYKCSVCGNVLKTEEVAAKGHTEGSDVVTKEATCFTKGSKTYTCTVCEKVINEEIPELYSSPVDAETGLAATSSSTYIYFGVFPKTVLASDSTVTVDKTENVTMGSNTYYKGSDGEYYAKVTENGYGSNYTYSDGTTVNMSSKNSTRYFKVEPIKWKVLTTDYNGTKKALLLAENILTANVPYYKYNSISYKRNVDTDTEIYHNNYKYSQIRAYLNGLDYYYDTSSTETTKVETYNSKGFLQTAFITSAQDLINTTTVDNSKETTGYSSSSYAEKYTCANTEDKIFLLSESEVIKTDYGFASYSSSGKGNARIRFATDYAKANYTELPSSVSSYGGCWWLRSPYYEKDNFACDISVDGNAYTSGCVVTNTSEGVVPALCISL